MCTCVESMSGAKQKTWILDFREIRDFPEIQDFLEIQDFREILDFRAIPDFREIPDFSGDDDDDASMTPGSASPGTTAFACIARRRNYPTSNAGRYNRTVGVSSPDGHCRVVSDRPGRGNNPCASQVIGRRAPCGQNPRLARSSRSVWVKPVAPPHRRQPAKPPHTRNKCVECNSKGGRVSQSGYPRGSGSAVGRPKWTTCTAATCRFWSTQGSRWRQTGQQTQEQRGTGKGKQNDR